jgi:hypothetical protein
MSDLEFDVMDELYFVISFEELLNSLGISELQLKEILSGLYGKGWIKVFSQIEEELPDENVDLENQYIKYFYLASKEGLMAHNRG